MKNIYLWLYSPCGLCSLFLFLNLYIDGTTPWMGDQPVANLCPYRFWSPPSLPYNVYWRRFLREQNGRGVKITIKSVVKNCEVYLHSPIGLNGRVEK
jgi:hypothetical protein